MSGNPTSALRDGSGTASAPSAIDPATFRSIMGAFPTGVAVITTRDADGAPKGFTSNAVTSVSMDPPLLLVCVALTSETLPVLRQARRFVVNYLKAGESDVSQRFARKGTDKFDGIALGEGGGLPVLHEHVIAHAECVTDSEVEAGDHIVLIGRVVDGDVDAEHEPLLYYRAGYPAWASA